VPITFDDAMQGFAEATKVRLKEDLIDQLGKEILMVQDVAAAMSSDPADLEENPAAMFRGSVFGISLRDGKAAGRARRACRREIAHSGHVNAQNGKLATSAVQCR